MIYEDAMNQMKQGHVARREGWDGHVRIEGFCMIRVRPNKLPFKFRATAADRAANDWVASAPPAVSGLDSVNLVGHEAVDGGSVRG